MATVAATRLREDAQEVRWVLFVDGIPLVWTTDNGQGGKGSIIGTGATSWIGRSEALIGGVEVIGARSVVSGLQMPESWTESEDIKASDLDPNPVVFKLHDDDLGTLAALFSREDKPFDILRERLPPGTSVLPVTALGTTGAIGIWGRNVGTERVGAAGQRRLFPALPEALVGFDHAVHQDVAGPGELPPIKVSDDPLQWAGRIFTLWSIYRDPDSRATDATAWPTWEKQTANLRLVGRVLNFRRQKGRVFELQCHGRDSLYRRMLGRVSTAQWQPISADRPRTATDSGFAVIFEARGSTPGTVVFNGSVFDTDLTAGDKGGINNEVNAIIADAVDGTSVNYMGGGGDLVDWDTPVAINQEADAGIDSAEFWVRKVDQVGNQFRLVMFVIMHSRDWRRLGYEPESQHFDTVHNATETAFQISFRQLIAGEPAKGTFDTGFAVPGDGYWRGRFSTVKIGGSEGLDGSNEWDNEGSKRYYFPKFSGEPYSIDLEAVGQVIRLGGGISPYIEGQLTVHHTGADVDGVPSERARYFAIRGNVQRLEEGSGGAIVLAPVEKTIQVARLEWVEGNYGSVDSGFGAIPVTILTKWMDPRLFGFNHKPLEGLEYWSGVAGGAGQLDALPLNAYAYQGDDTPEFAHSLWSQLLLSTGSGGGYVGDVLTDGDNAPAGIVDQDLFWGSDVAIADLGCGVPSSLVAPLEDIRAAFATVPGGSGGPLNRVRYAYAGPFLAQDMLASLMRPRRLIWRLHGDRMGLVKLAPFSPGDADVTISQDDLYADGEDPRSLEPVQLPNPVGSLDGVELAFRWDPESSRTAESWTVRAQDAEAGARTGELVQQLPGHGLIAWDWGVPDALGVGDWREDFRVLWAFDAAEFLSLDHYAITLTVSRPKGQDLRPGTRVLLNNPWPYNNGGGYGLVNHVAIVTSITPNTSTHAVEVELFVFAGQAQGVRHFSPGARVLEQVGSVLTLSEDQYLHGDPLANDADGYVEPPWSAVGGTARVQLLCRVGDDWSLGSIHAVSSFDDGTNELTLASPPDTSKEYEDRWVLFTPHDGQSPASFPRAIYGAIALGNLTHGSVPTVARPFHP